MQCSGNRHCIATEHRALKAQILADCKLIVETEALCAVTDADRSPEICDPTDVRMPNPGQDPQERCLTTAVRTEQAVNLAGSYHQRDVRQGGSITGETAHRRESHHGLTDRDGRRMLLANLCRAHTKSRHKGIWSLPPRARALGRWARVASSFAGGRVPPKSRRYPGFQGHPPHTPPARREDQDARRKAPAAGHSPGAE